MGKRTTPYAIKAAIAALTGSPDQIDDVFCEAMNDIASDLKRVTMKYEGIDFPFVAASMIIVGRAIKSLLDDDGSRLVDHIVNNTTAMTIDRNELIKQAGAEPD